MKNLNISQYLILMLLVALLIAGCGAGGGTDSDAGGGETDSESVKQLIPDGKYRYSALVNENTMTGSVIKATIKGDPFVTVKWLGNGKYRFTTSGNFTYTFGDTIREIDCSSPNISEIVLDDNGEEISYTWLQRECLENGKESTGERAEDVRYKLIDNGFQAIFTSTRNGVKFTTTLTYISENVTENKFSIPDTVREEFELDAYYKQWVDAGGIPVVSRENVNPYALEEAAWLIQQVIGHRPEVLEEMAEKKVRFAVIPYNSTLAQIPEINLDDFKKGGKIIIRDSYLLDDPPVIFVSEENLLNYPGDAFEKRSILIGTFSRAMLDLKLYMFVPDFVERIEAAYNKTQEMYPDVRKIHFWYWSTWSWFSDREIYSIANNPELATLLADVFGDRDWRYTPVAMRTDLPHLEGFDPQNSPTFEWRPEFFECDPIEDRCDEWVNLKQYDPSELSSLTSTQVEETVVYFINTTSTDLFLYWKNYSDIVQPFRHENGELVKISPNYPRRVDTHNTNVWVVRNQDGENLAVFQAKEKTGFAVYRGVTDSESVLQLIPDGKYRLSALVSENTTIGLVIEPTIKGDLFVTVKWLGNGKYRLTKSGNTTLTIGNTIGELDCSSPDIVEIVLDDNGEEISFNKLNSGCLLNGKSAVEDPEDGRYMLIDNGFQYISIGTSNGVKFTTTETYTSE